MSLCQVNTVSGFRVNLFSLFLRTLLIPHAYFWFIHPYQKAGVKRNFSSGDIENTQRNEMASSHSNSLLTIRILAALAQNCTM
jgi:hypothetical protein